MLCNDGTVLMVTNFIIMFASVVRAIGLMAQRVSLLWLRKNVPLADVNYSFLV